MKKLVITSLFLSVVFSLTLFTGCGGTAKQDEGKAESANKTNVFYTCPMHPNVKSKKDGKCPECGMALVEASLKSKTETIGVNGNCGMCKEAIEGTLGKNKAISAASWDESTKKLTVTYEPDKITIDQIRQLVADVGYDTDKIRAKDEVYEELPGCCKYVRKK